MNDPELNAMGKIAETLEALSAADRRQVLRWNPRRDHHPRAPEHPPARACDPLDHRPFHPAESRQARPAPLHPPGSSGVTAPAKAVATAPAAALPSRPAGAA